MKKYLYNIYCKPIFDETDKRLVDLNRYYNNIYTNPIDSGFAFEKEPTKEEVIEFIEYVRPSFKCDVSTLKIEFKRELYQDEY